MDWSKTKTIFIIVFLILDVFLAVQYFDKKNKSEFDLVPKSTVEEQLAEANITYSPLPNILEKGSYITAKRKEFTSSELTKLKNQRSLLPTISMKEPIHKLRMEFIKPIPAIDNYNDTKIDQFLATNIIEGKQYRLWKVDMRNRQVLFLQQYKGKQIFQENNNGIGMLVFYLNEKNEIISYEQTLLRSIEELEEDLEILPAINAIQALYDKNEIKVGSNVKSVKLGYYTQYPLENVQILTPTWHLVVNEQDFFVTLDGKVINPNKVEEQLE